MVPQGWTLCYKEVPKQAFHTPNCKKSSVRIFSCPMDRFVPDLSLLFSSANFSFLGTQKTFGIYRPKDGTHCSEFETSSGTGFNFQNTNLQAPHRISRPILHPPISSTTECSLFQSQSQPSRGHRNHQNHQVHSYSILTSTLMDRDFCIKYGKDTQHSFQRDYARNLENGLLRSFWIQRLQVLMATTIHLLF